LNIWIVPPSNGAAVRARRLRQRQRLGLRVVGVEIDEWRTIDALISRGVLTEAEGLDPGAVARGLGKVIDAWVRSP
jgi:hypothetical protein